MPPKTLTSSEISTIKQWDGPVITEQNREIYKVKGQADIIKREIKTEADEIHDELTISIT